MNILKLKAANVMNIDAAEIPANGQSVTLTGKNGAGKSAFLKAIEFALSGKALAATPEPVRHGEKSGEIILDLGDIIVKRHFTNSSSTVKIENKEGAVFKSPQALLDKFKGNISFDPMAFAGLPEKQQKDILLGMIDLDIDLDELDAKRQAIYDERTDINRDIKKLTGQLAAIPECMDVPDDELSSVDVMAEMQAATEQIATNTRGRELLRKYNLDHTVLLEKQARLEAELNTCIADIQAISTEIERIAPEINGMVDPDLEQFKCKLLDVETINTKVRQNQARKYILSEIKNLKGKSQGMTVDMTAIDKVKTETISKAGMPVDGLGFNESGVTYNDVPLSQCSDGQKRLISARIGMAMNPKLKVLWLNDAEGISEIKTIADEQGYQLWLECVSDDEHVVVHIGGEN